MRIDNYRQKLRLASAVPRREVAAAALTLQRTRKEANKGQGGLTEWKKKIDTARATSEDLLAERVGVLLYITETHQSWLTAPVFLRSKKNGVSPQCTFTV